jgi:HAE1 family hydrophobic/amphiphilic exporter-1
VVKQLFAKTASMKDAKILFFTPPSIREGTTDGFELKIEDKGNDDWQTVSKVSNEFLGELMKRPEIQYAITNFNPNFPQYQMDINVERAKDAVWKSQRYSTLWVLWWFVYHRL